MSIGSGKPYRSFGIKDGIQNCALWKGLVFPTVLVPTESNKPITAVMRGVWYQLPNLIGALKMVEVKSFGEFSRGMPMNVGIKAVINAPGKQQNLRLRRFCFIS